MDQITQEAPKPQIATQPRYKISTSRGEFTFPGLATGQDGSVTLSSLIDMLIVLAATPEAERDQILQANDVIVRDLDGKLYFPRPKAP